MHRMNGWGGGGGGGGGGVGVTEEAKNRPADRKVAQLAAAAHRSLSGAAAKQSFT